MIDDFVDRYPRSHFGPSHILLSDQNTLDTDILFCIRETWGELKESRGDEQLTATLNFLIDLSAIDEDTRCEPEQVAWSDGTPGCLFYCYPDQHPSQEYHEANWVRVPGADET
jgi:hypothetical protein